MKKIAILQSNYIPWKGVFDLINRVDTFVFLEDVQYTEHDWRNRNKILVGNEAKWLIVPVKNSGRRGQKIYQAEINNNNWAKKHYNAFNINYSKAKHFKDFKWILDQIYIENKWSNLSQLNMFSTKLISDVLGIKTEFISSKDLDTAGKKDDKIIDICKQLDATEYISGQAAKSYIHPEKFIENNIVLNYIDYSYPRYSQYNGEFVTHNVSILDLIFNCGSEAPKYIWG